MNGGATLQSSSVGSGPSGFRGSLIRVGKYCLRRIGVLFITVVVGTYLAILIANWGGQMDQVIDAQIREGVSARFAMDPQFRFLSPEEKTRRQNVEIERQRKRYGLDRGFFWRSLEFEWNALSLNLGRAKHMSSDSGSREVRNIILERLPTTLLLFLTADLLLFFGAISIALYLSRKYGSVLDRIVVALAPTSTAPAWFYGIFLIMIFAAVLNWLPFGNMVDIPPPSGTVDYALSVLKHMILPTMSVVIAAICLSTFSWRTFFLIYSSEDYVEMAKAKGLSSGMIQRRYILRPTLPPIITGFSFMLIGLWQGAIILETVFNWPGLGRLLYIAIGANETAVIIGEVVIYGYLLAFTVFVLDLVYALIDPRVKVGGAS